MGSPLARSSGRRLSCNAPAIIAPELIPARIRIPSYAVWDTVVFVLNVFVWLAVARYIECRAHGFSVLYCVVP